MLRAATVFYFFCVICFIQIYFNTIPGETKKPIKTGIITETKHDPGPMMSKYIGEELCSIRVFNKQTKEKNKEISDKFLKLKKECFNYRITDQKCMTEKFGIILASCNKRVDIESYNKK